MRKYFRSIALLPVAVCLFWSSTAQALARQEISTDTALSNVSEITVPRGHSVVLQFQNDHYIQSLWIDDPTIVGIATNRPLCGQTGSRQCGYASSARLTQLSGAVALPGTHFSSQDGVSTLVSVSTTNRSGTNPQIYQFKLNIVNASTASTSLVAVVPDRSRSEEYTNSLLRSIRPNYDLEKIRTGRDMAVQQGIADTNSSAWLALENFLSMTQRGIGIEAAIDATAVSIELLAELERMVELTPSPAALFTYSYNCCASYSPFFSSSDLAVLL